MISARLISVTVVLALCSYAATQSFVVRQLMPNTKIPSFHRVSASDDPRQNQPKYSDGDEIRDGLRQAVLTAADDLLENPCNDYSRSRYIAAATKYARAWLSIATCFPHCTGKTEDQLDLAARAFNTPFDNRVASKMARVHQTDTIREGDFTPDVAFWVAARSRDIAINPKASPAKRASERASRAPLTCRR